MRTTFLYLYIRKHKNYTLKLIYPLYYENIDHYITFEQK